MRFIFKLGFSSMLCVLTVSTSSAQDVEGFWTDIKNRIQQKDYVRLSGGVQAGLHYNQIAGIAARRDPFRWNVNAHLGIDLLGIAIPFTAAFSRRSEVYNVPAYAFYGCSPSYQWIRLHLGDRSLSYSPYSLSGHNFKGVGVELQPGRFYFSAMRGRLRRARIQEAGSLQNLESPFTRTAWGFKVAYGDADNRVGVVLFQASDEDNTLVPDSVGYPSPKDNVVIGVQGSKKISDLFQFTFDFTRSAINRDTRSVLVSNQRGVFKRMLGLFTPTVSTAYHNASAWAVVFSPTFGQFQLAYERIDPGYRSLGTLFFNNDTEQLSLSGSLPVFKKKVQLSAHAGWQRNNLDGASAVDLGRFVGSLRLSAALHQKLNVSAAVSNLQTTNRFRAVRIPFVQVDSIVLVRTNTSASLTVNYLAGAQQESVFTGLVSYQSANTIQNDEIDFNQESALFTTLLSHTYAAENTNWQLTTAGTLNYNQTADVGFLMLGPSLRFAYALLEQKLNLTNSLQYSLVYNDQRFSNRVFTYQLAADYQMNERQNVNLNVAYAKSSSDQSSIDQRHFTDWNLRLQYRYRFTK